MFSSQFEDSDTQETSLELQQVSKRFRNGQYALHEVNLSISPGQMVFVSGQSGSGKSTLLKMCALLTKPTTGLIYYQGKNTLELTSRQRLSLRRSMSLISQKPLFIDDQNVAANLALPLTILGYDADEIKQRVEQTLEHFQLQGVAHLHPVALSMGEQACLNVARALITSPQLILADEPMHHIDPKRAQFLFDALQQVNEQGTSIVFATHDLNLIARTRSPVYFLENGLLQSGGVSS